MSNSLIHFQHFQSIVYVSFLSLSAKFLWTKVLLFSLVLWLDNIHKFLLCIRCPSSGAHTNQSATRGHHFDIHKCRELLSRIEFYCKFLRRILFFLYRDISDNQLVCAACDCNRSETNHNCKVKKN